MRTLNPFRGGLTYATAGHAVYAACQWGMISVLARLSTPEMAGQYALGVAVSAPILLLVRPRPRSSRATDIRILSLVFALMGVAAVGFLERSLQDRLAILLVVMAQSVEWVAEIYAGRRTALSLVLHGCGSVAVLAVLSSASGRVGAGLLGVLIVRLLLLFFYDFRRVPKDETPEGRETLLGSLAANAPCYFIAHMLGYRWLGTFAALAAVLSVFEVLAGAVAAAADPELVEKFREGDEAGFRRTTMQLAGAGVLLGLCTFAISLLAGPKILELLFGPEYAAPWTLLIAMAAAAATGNIGMLLAGVLRRASLALEIAVITSVAFACVWLVPRFGLTGAALAVWLGCLARLGGELWMLRALLRRVQRPVLMALLKQPVSF